MSLSDLEMCRKSFLQAARENSTVGPLRTPSDDADDGELLVADETLSLTCPLTLTRLVYAVKGKDCTHRQCFDMMVGRLFVLASTA